MAFRADLNTGWNSGARSRKVCLGDCQARFSVPQTNTGAVIGFNSVDADAGFREIKHGIMAYKSAIGPLVEIYESGVKKATVGPYVTSDVFTIRREGLIVKYYKNSTLLYTSLVPSQGAIFLDASLYSAGDKIL